MADEKKVSSAAFAAGVRLRRVIKLLLLALLH